MNKEEAKELLSFHSCRNGDIHNLKWKDGFLGSLRPFCGSLRKENLIEIMDCMETLKEEFVKPAVDRDIMCDIMGIIHLTRAWASPEGMLGRNSLLTKEQTEELLLWVDIIEECLMYLLEEDYEDAFWMYHEYMDNRL